MPQVKPTPTQGAVLSPLCIPRTWQYARHAELAQNNLAEGANVESKMRTKKEIDKWGWGGGSVVKNICSFSRGSGFGLQPSGREALNHL